MEYWLHISSQEISLYSEIVLYIRILPIKKKSGDGRSMKQYVRESFYILLDQE